MLPQRGQKGFTLIELLIVIAIIGILAAVLIPNLLNARARAYDSGAQTCANSMQTAQEVYWIDHDIYTTNVDDLADHLATACQGIQDTTDGEVSIDEAATDEEGWAGTVMDPRGTQTYTVTHDDLTSAPQE